MTIRTYFSTALEDLFNYKHSREMRNGQVELRDKWNAGPKWNTDNTDMFYKNIVGDSYLYDLAAWHASGSIVSWGELVEEYAKGVVWDFGAGIGTYTLIACSLPGVERVYFDDINLENASFALWRIGSYSFLLKVLSQKPQEPMDTIIALDVIEHLGDPWFQLGEFNRLSHSGTILVVNITDHTSGGQHPMHLMNSKMSKKWFDDLAKDWNIVKSGSPSVWRRK